jgi:glycine/sarcosine N-methyltransferase
MYDRLSTDYDRFVNWQARLSVELPFIIEKLQVFHAQTILDAAAGTGMHAIALAQCGFIASGADISQGMIARAQSNATSAGVEIKFTLVGFGNLAPTFGRHSFDALFCLGNSLPHLLSQSALSEALADFSACLRPGGMLLLQNRNFDAVLRVRDRWMEPQSHTEKDVEWVFHRFYDFDPDGLLTFNLVTLKRERSGNWTEQHLSSRLRPLLKDDLVSALKESGFTVISVYGDMTGSPFIPETSSNLVVLAIRQE